MESMLECTPRVFRPDGNQKCPALSTLCTEAELGQKRLSKVQTLQFPLGLPQTKSFWGDVLPEVDTNLLLPPHVSESNY